MIDNPKISILTPTYNAMEYLQNCIQSVLSQEYQNLEHVIADAGSTDGTFEYLESLSKQYPGRIIVTKSKNDFGVGDGLNSAFRRSSGNIIGWLDSDDMLEPGSIEKIVQSFNANSDLNFIYGNCNIINKQGKKTGEFIVRDFDKWEWVNRWHYIIFCATYFRREVVETVGFVNSLGNDLDFFLRVAKKYNLNRVNFTIANWRYHELSISHEKSPRSEKIRFNRSKQDFLIVIKNRGNLLSPKSMNFMLILAKKISDKNLVKKTIVFLKIHKVKSFYIHNILNSNVFVKPGESFSRKISKIFLRKLKSKILVFVRRSLVRVAKKFRPLIWGFWIFDFAILEMKHLRKQNARKKFYKKQ